MGQATIRTKKFKGKQVDPQQSVYEVKEGRPETRRKSVDFTTYSKRDWGTRNDGRFEKCVHGNVRKVGDRGNCYTKIHKNV